MMRAEFIFLVCLTGCVLIESPGVAPERGCGEKGVAPDDGRCHCDIECQHQKLGSTCLAEYEFGYPGGVCTRRCKVDTDCSPGFICGGVCLQVCTESSDCAAGRMCRARSPGLSVCDASCDEDTDCEGSACNAYRGMCLLFEEKIRGAGLNAPCKSASECRSNTCIAGACLTRCDPSSPHCPEGGVCVDEWCESACAAPENCALNQSCVETDAGKFCSD